VAEVNRRTVDEFTETLAGMAERCLDDAQPGATVA
jgi:hypothetical protein